MGFFKRQRTTTDAPANASPRDPLERVLPAVRSMAPLQRQSLVRQIHGLPPMTIPARPLAGNLHISLVEDLPDAVAYVDEQKLDEWGMSFDDAYSRALANLQAHDPDGLTLRVASVSGGNIYTAFGSDDYLGTRLLTPGYFSRVDLPKLIVAINPDRNSLILADATSPAAMIQAFDDAIQFADSPGFVSMHPIVGDGTLWQDLELPEGHPAKSALHQLLALDQGLQANALGPELQQLVGPNVLVEAVVSRDDSGRIDTLTCWREGHTGLIAETDTIGFLRHDPNAPIVYASWQAAIDTVGMLMQPMSLPTPRWQLNAFPSDEQLEHMGARPLPSEDEPPAH